MSTSCQAVSALFLVIVMLGCFKHVYSYTSMLNRRYVLNSFGKGAVRFERGGSVASKLAFLEKVKLHAGFGAFGSSVVSKKKKMKILKYPHPQLRAENEVISSFDEELKEIVNEMLVTMYEDDGIGLAAPQVGINKQLMVFNQEGDATKPESEMVLVNPVIIAAAQEKDLGEEGCLSFPQIHGQVERSKWIEVEFQTITGEKASAKFEGRPAIIFQHEFDHLNKVLFIDRLIDEDKKLNEKRLMKAVKKYGPGAAA